MNGAYGSYWITSEIEFSRDDTEVVVDDDDEKNRRRNSCAGVVVDAATTMGVRVGMVERTNRH